MSLFKRKKKDIEIKKNISGYYIKFNSEGLNHYSSYKSIEDIVKKAIEGNKKLTIDLSDVEYANGDFFYSLIAEYWNA
jgi:anti-anti-sigma regulatory factor